MFIQATAGMTQRVDKSDYIALKGAVTMEIFRADKKSSESLFSRLSDLDKRCVGNDGWSAESFKSEAEKDNGIVLYAVENDIVTGLNRHGKV